MSPSLEDAFDVAILGTGLSESILAAALARAGHKVLHLDQNEYYGSRAASLTLQELIDWAENHSSPSSAPSAFSSVSYSFPSSSASDESRKSVIANSRQYALSLSPSLISSSGPLIDALVQSGVSRYSAFRLLDVLAVVSSDSDSSEPKTRPVPSSKEDIFKDRSLSLIAKRKLMKVLQYALGEFEGTAEWAEYSQLPALDVFQSKFGLDRATSSAILFSVAGSSSSSELACDAFPRLRRYMRSYGRYGLSPFLVGHYGGLGEIAQGFCRSCAVSGGTYILGREITSIQSVPVPSSDGQDEDGNKNESIPPHARFALTISDLSSPLYASSLILPQPSPPSSLSPSPNTQFLRAILIINNTVKDLQSLLPDTAGDADSLFLSFPPGSIPGALGETTVYALVTGSGSMSCPRGESIIYLGGILPPSNTDSTKSADDLLRPYVAYLLRSPSSSSSFGPSPSPDSDPIPDSNTNNTPVIPLFSLFYIEFSSSPPSFPSPLPASTPFNLDADNEHIFHIPTSLPSTAPFTEIGDLAASRATEAFWAIVKKLAENAPVGDSKGEDGEDGGEGGVPDIMWPELDALEDDDLMG